MTGTNGVLRIACAHDLAYTPQYVGLALGLFEDVGLRLDMVQYPPGVAGVVDTIPRGAADLLLGSLLYAVRLHETGTDTHIVTQSNQQTRNVLMVRPGAAEGFAWEDLRGRAILVYPGEAPTAWAAFQDALFQHGLTCGDVKLIFGYTAADAVDEFVRGVGDFLLIDAEAALDDRLAHAVAVSDGVGKLPWSIYSTSGEVVRTRGEDLNAFAIALSRAQSWIRSHDAAETAEVISPSFPQYAQPQVARILKRYLELDLWPESSKVQLDQVLRWEAGLRRGGLIGIGKPLTEVITVHV